MFVTTLGHFTILGLNGKAIMVRINVSFVMFVSRLSFWCLEKVVVLRDYDIICVFYIIIFKVSQ